MLRLQITAALSTKSASNTVKDAEMAVETDKRKLDITDVTTVKISERSGTVKKKGKGTKSKGKKRNKGEKKDKKEEDPQKSGNNGEQRNSNVPNELDADKTQCTPKTVNLKPRTQSNIWIKVAEDKTTQDVQLAFMRTEVPKSLPIPPPTVVTSQAKMTQEKTTRAKKKKPKKKTKKK